MIFVLIRLPVSFESINCVSIFQQKFDKFILMKITTRCHILKLNAPNSTSAGALPQTPLGSLQRSSDSLAGFKGPASNGSEEAKGRGEGKGKGRRREGEGRGAP